MGNNQGNAKEEIPIRQDNPYSAIQLLIGHTDIIRSLIVLDDTRFASGADDGLVIIWDSTNGQKLLELRGHTQPITCFLVLHDQRTLVSGAADKSLRIWDIETGECKKFIQHSHERGGVKCLVAVDKNRFCSGGNDDYLCLWDNDGTLLGKISRQIADKGENLHCLLSISKNRVITASNSKFLIMYDVDALTYCNIFTFHRESVHCLVRCNSDLFVSASLDGVIIVWKEDLTVHKKLSFPDKYLSQDDHKYFCAVNNLHVIGTRFVAACIGKGFKIYDVLTGDLLLHCVNAHESSVQSIIAIRNGSRLITASLDGKLKLWCSRPEFFFDDPDFTQRVKKMKGSSTKPLFIASCLGEMHVHGDEVNHLVKINENSFASGSHDHLVVLWHDYEEKIMQQTENAEILFYEKNKNIMQQNFEHQHVVSESIDSTNEDLYDYNNDDTGEGTASEGDYSSMGFLGFVFSSKK